MRIDPDHCRDPDLLAAEVRRLQAVIAAGQPTLTDEEREAIKMAVAACKIEEELNRACDGRQSFAGLWSDRAGVLRSLLERLGE